MSACPCRDSGTACRTCRRRCGPVVLAAALPLLLVAGPARAAADDAMAELTYTNIWRDDLDEPGGDAEVNGDEYTLRLGPLYPPRGSGLAVGMYYDYVHYEFSQINAEGRDLHRLSLPVAWTSDRGTWSWTAELRPGIATSSNKFNNWSRLDRDDVEITGRVTARRRDAGGRRWEAGLAGDHSFGTYRVYPVGGVSFRPSDRWRIDAFFPSPRIVYQPAYRWRLRLALDPRGGRWNVRSKFLDRDTRFRREGWRAQAHVDYRAWGVLWVSAYAGLEFDRQLAFRDRTNQFIETDVGDTPVAGLSLRLER